MKIITSASYALITLLFLSTFSTGTAFSQGGLEFLAPRAYDGGRGFAAGDLNSDKNPDVVTVRADRVDLRLGTGTEVLASTSTTVYQCSNFTSTAMTQPFIDDYNGDGKQDIAVWIDDSGCRGARAVMVLPGNGNGTFGAPIFTEITNFVFTPNQFASADLNGDGRPDLMIAIAFSATNDRVGILLNNGNGTFAPPVEYNFGVNQSGMNLTAADIDGDQRPDLLFGNRSPESIMAMHNNGNGTFAAATTVISGTSIIASAGHFNADNFVDIITTQITNNVPFIRAWLGNGNGVFTASAPVALSADGDFIGRVMPVDLNNDGKQGLAIQVNGRTVVVRGNGDGTFVEDAVYGVGGGGGLFAADFNKDGWIDLGVNQVLSFEGSPRGQSNEFSLLINLQDGSLAVAPWLELPVPGEDTEVADMNGDGLNDVVLTGDAESGEILVVLQDGARKFAARRADQRRSAQLMGPLSPKALAVGDVDGDTIKDVIVAGAKTSTPGDNVLIAKNDGNGNLSFLSSFSLPGKVVKVVIGQFNADDIPDVAFAVGQTPSVPALQVAFGNGNGTFSTPVGYLNNLGAISLGAVDLNGDQRTDLAVGLSNRNIVIMLNNGNGTFTQGATFTTGADATDIVAADMNGDAKADLIVASNVLSLSDTNKVSVYTGLGDGTFSGPASYPTVDLYNQKIAVADYNGDGKPDVAVTNNGVVSVLVNNGSGTLLPRTMWATTGGLNSIASGDMDGNGRADLVTTSSYNQFFSMGLLFSIDVPTLVQRRTRFDFDGDGKSDESVFRPANNVWYLNRSQAGFTGYQFGSAGDLLSPADFTGDGKTDVAVFRPSVGAWFVLRSEDNTFYSANFGANGDVPAPGDFDGDGKADTAVFRPSTGYWFLQQSTAGFSAVPFGANGDLPTIGDFDGDGKTDVAVFRPTAGVWYRLNSSNGSFFAAQFGQPGDKVVAADYTGDGKTDIAVWRPSNGTWYIQRSEDNSFYGQQFGLSADLPTPGDYDGDGKADVAVFRPGSGTWFEQRSTSGFTAVQFGTNGDKPAPNAFVY